MQSKLKVIFDKKLFGKTFFFRGIPYIIFAIIIQYLLIYKYSKLHYIYFYLPFSLVFILITGAISKNNKRQFHLMNWKLSIIMLIGSAFSKGFALVAPFNNSVLGFFQRMFVLSLSELMLLFSLLSIIINSQRQSLRSHIGLDNGFFKNKISALNKKIDDSSIKEKISEIIDEGYFNVTVLWSCNLIEKLTDELIERIIHTNSSREKDFRNDDGKWLSYPKKINKLGFSYKGQIIDDKEFSEKIMWHKIRNRIAHHNYLPSYIETEETLKMLIKFIQKIPHLKNLENH